MDYSVCHSVCHSVCYYYAAGIPEAVQAELHLLEGAKVMRHMLEIRVLLAVSVKSYVLCTVGAILARGFHNFWSYIHRYLDISSSSKLNALFYKSNVLILTAPLLSTFYHPLPSCPVLHLFCSNWVSPSFSV